MPDFLFDEHLVFPNVSEWDIISIAVANGYIPQCALQNVNSNRHGVFSAATSQSFAPMDRETMLALSCLEAYIDKALNECCLNVEHD
jgi:hypothetical protein